MIPRSYAHGLTSLPLGDLVSRPVGGANVDGCGQGFHATQARSEITATRRLARFNSLVTNRIQGLYAWLVPPWAVILHRGRRSGRQYRTPLFAFKRDRTLVIALLYGRRSDWLRNLRHGGGHVIRAGRTLTIAPPEIVDASDARSVLARLSRPERAYCRLAEALAIIELGEQLPGFGPRRRGVSEPSARVQASGS